MSDPYCIRETGKLCESAQAEIDKLTDALEQATERLFSATLAAESQRKRIEQLESAFGDLIKSCQAIIDNRHENLSERDDVEPYLKNRLMIARRSLPYGDSGNG